MATSPPGVARAATGGALGEGPGAPGETAAAAPPSPLCPTPSETAKTHGRAAAAIAAATAIATAADAHAPVLEAVSRLLHDPAFHDVEFFCGADGGIVTANRSFLAARNPYFEALLFGPHREGIVAAASAAADSSSSSSSMARVCLPAASARALRRVLSFLHTGELPPEPGEGESAGKEQQEQHQPPLAGAAAALLQPPPTTTTTTTVPWRVLLETCGLAQQLLLPEVVAPLARRVARELTPRDAGPALSAALEAGLQPVVGQLWRALPRLMPGGAGAAGAAATRALDLTGGYGERQQQHQSSSPLLRRGLTPRFSGDAGFSAAAIAFLLECVPATVLAGRDVAPAALAGTGGSIGSSSKARRQGGGSGGGGSLLAGTSAGDGGGGGAGALRSGGGGGLVSAEEAQLVPSSPLPPSSEQQQQHQTPKAAAAASTARRSIDGDTAGTTAAAAGAAPEDDDDDEEDNGTRRQRKKDTPLALLDDLCDQVRTPEERLLRGVLDWAVFELLLPSQHEEGDGGANAQGQHRQLSPSRERVLASLLLRLDWAAIAPRWLERLLRPGGAARALLPSAKRRAQVSRAALLCLHGSAAGRLSLAQTAPAAAAAANAALATANDHDNSDDSSAPTLPLVRRLARWGGGEVLECAAVPHVTVQSRRPFPSSGRHCFTVAVEQACDLVWLGLSDGTVDPQGWGGKSKGAWLVGSNDALCHNAQSDRSAYATLCGLGKWGDGATIGVFLDCDAGECHFALLAGGGGGVGGGAAAAVASSSSGGVAKAAAAAAGGELKQGFGGLPTEASTPDEQRRPLYAAASIRAPAQLAFRWRPWSWLQREFEDSGEEEEEE